MATDRTRRFAQRLVAVLRAALIAIMAASAAGCALAYLLAFVLPGHMLCRLFARGKERGFEGALLSVALSLALLPPFALALGWFARLSPLHWALGLAAFSAVAFWLSASRFFDRAAASRRARPKLAAFRSWRRVRALVATFDSRQLVPVGGVALMVAVAFMIVQHGALSQRQFAYTELWMVPSDRSDRGLLTIGVRNEEQGATSYNLEVTLGGELVKRWSDIFLPDGAEMIDEISLPFAAGRYPAAEAKLYRSDRPSVLYRHAIVRLPDRSSDLSRN